MNKSTVKRFDAQKEHELKQKRIYLEQRRNDTEHSIAKDKIDNSKTRTISYEERVKLNKKHSRLSKAARLEIEHDFESLEEELEIGDNYRTELITDQLMKLDISDILDLPFAENFECVLFKGNEAWIDCDDDLNGAYRYFSRNIKTNEIVMANIYDFYHIVKGYDINSSVLEMTSKIEHTWKERDWMEKQIRLYHTNNNVLVNENYRKTHPILYKAIKGLQGTLINLTSFAASKQICWTNSVEVSDNKMDNLPVFFCAVRFLEKYSEANGLKASKSKIAKDLAYLKAIGIVIEHPLYSVPAHMIESAKKTANSSDHNHIAFYSLEELTKDVLDRAELLVTVLSDKGIKPSTINYSKLAESMGIEFADCVYKQKPVPKKELTASPEERFSDLPF